jgi:cysteine desulfurase
VLGCSAREIVFTGGGTEAINLAVAGTAMSPEQRARPIVISAIEHDAVREATKAQGAAGASIVEAPVDRNGVLDLHALEALLVADTRLVAVMAVNNEVGTIQPIGQIIERTRHAAPKALVLVDAVQGAAWIKPTNFAGADLVVISAHKFGGPQGVGAIRIREGVQIDAIIHGGGQERERRSGTQNVAGIVGMAAALRNTHAQLDEVAPRIAAKRDRLVDGLLAAVPNVVETSDRAVKVAGNAHLCVADVESESLLVLLDDGGVCASAGSACASGAIHTSPVLAAMGVEARYATGALRLTLGPSTTDADIDRALTVIPDAIRSLRVRALTA